MSARTAMKQFLQSTLRREVLGILVIKGILLGLLWWICFSDPVEPHLTIQKVQHQLFGDAS